jgi:hypothetical protein
MYVRFCASLARVRSDLCVVLFAQKQEQRCRSFFILPSMRRFACSHYFTCRHRPPTPHGPHILLDQPRIVHLLGPFFRVRTVYCQCADPTLVIKTLRITPRPCCSSGTHTRPSSSPLSSISCLRICPRTPKRRRPSFANAVCRGKLTRNADGVGSPERSGSSLSGLSGGSRRWGENSVYVFPVLSKTECAVIRMVCSFCSL